MINKSFASADLKEELLNSSCLPFLFGCQEAKSQVLNLTKSSRHLLLHNCVLLCQGLHSYFMFTFSLILSFYIYKHKLLSLVRRTVPSYHYKRDLGKRLATDLLTDLGNKQVQSASPLAQSPEPRARAPSPSPSPRPRLPNFFVSSPHPSPQPRSFPTRAPPLLATAMPWQVEVA